MESIMRKILITLVAVGVLLCAITASQALTVYVQTVDVTSINPIYAPNDWVGGVFDDSGWMLNTLFPQDGGAPHAYFAVPLATPTYGRCRSWYWWSAPGDPTSVTWTNVEAWYGLNIWTAGDASAHTILVKGRITGNYVYDVATGNYGGGGTWKAYELYDLTTSTAYTVPVPDPVSGIIPHLYKSMTFADGPVNLYVEQRRNIPVPQLNDEMTGVITTVPEPGAVAMLFGSGIVGSLLVWRRRRNA